MGNITSLEQLEPDTLADVAPINSNFDKVREEINDNDSRISSLRSETSNNLQNIRAEFKELSSTTVPVGAIIYNAKIPNGYLRCDGSLVSRTQYAKLFNVIGTTFGAGDNSTTFALPKLTDNRFVEGYTSAGTYKDAGLPNIKTPDGDNGIGHIGNSANKISGALESVVVGKMAYSGSGANLGRIKFDASRCSSVYGNSDTVQPKSLTLIPCIKY